MSYNNNITDNPKCQYKILNPEWQRISDSVSSPLIKRVTYYKYANRKIIAALNAIGERDKAGAIYGCGTFVRVGRRNGHETITESNFCRQRLCQVCAWRRSARFTAQMFPVIRNLQARGYQAIFITLTVKNPTADGVRHAIDVLLHGWDKLIHNNRVYRRCVRGFVRSIEITYNLHSGTYHPHIHALWFMDATYATKYGEYITQKQLMSDWKNAAGLTYDPIVYMQSVKRIKNGGSTSNAAVVETLKYCYKIDSKSINNETIATLLYGLAGRRLVSFGGVVATERRALQQGDIDDNLNDDNGGNNTYDVLYIFNPAGWRIIENNETDGGV